MSRFIFTIVLVLLLFGGVSAGIIKVPQNYATIQAGIDAAVKGDTVLVAAGTYFENINFKGKAITVASYYLVDSDTTHINKTIIDGSKPSHADSGSVVFFISGEDTTSVLCGFTITKGSGTDTTDLWTGIPHPYPCRAGGGILCYNSGARILNNKIIGNTVNSPDKYVYGGGLAALPWGSTAWVILAGNQIAHNTVTANSAVEALGGGVWLYCNGIVSHNLISFNSVIQNASNGDQAADGGLGCASDPTDRRHIIVEFNKITHNSVFSKSNITWAWDGGFGIYGSYGRFANNEISYNELWVNFDNYAGAAGLSIAYAPASLIIEGNIVRNNSVKQGSGVGGGILIGWNSSPTVINNIIEGNSASVGGGLRIEEGATSQLINNTIINNQATSGGGISIRNATVYLMNNIVWGNQASAYAAIFSRNATVEAAYCDIQGGWAGTGNIDANPLFAFPDHQLSNSSPCIGAGIASLPIGGTTYNCPSSDIEGNPRPDPSGSKPDIGAYENPLPTPQGPFLVPEQYASIQAGINAARDGDVVLVRDNTYYENINFKGKAITVASYYLVDGDTTHINNAIIDGSKPSHADSGSVVFFISGEDTTSVLCGFTITKGSGTETIDLWGGIQIPCRAGGGILCYNSGARILNNKIISNAVNSPDKYVYGGGLAALPWGSTAWVILAGNQIAHNTVTANSAVEALGGGVWLYCNGIVSHNLISFNSVIQNASNGDQAADGGFGCASDPTDRRHVIVESNKITHNSVFSKSNLTRRTWDGGFGIYGSYGRFANNEVSYNELWVNFDIYAGAAGLSIAYAPASLIIEGNIVRNNSVKQGSGLGGGVVIESASPTVINNIIEGNSATVGGGLLIAGGTSQLINNTVINNQATRGGGIDVRFNATVYLMNNIVWGNQASTYAGIQLEDATIKAAYCDIQGGWSGTGNFNSDPLFADTLFQLSNSSLCIGAGVASFDMGGVTCCCPTTDIAGHSRPDPAGSSPDIGAWESPLPPTEVMNFAETKIPQSYFLAQNYPNPFNPSTTIEFALPKSAFVTLKVYNLLGEEVAKLVAEQRTAGIHKLHWDAKGLASGVYLYRLEAGEFVQAKKLILMR